MVFRVRIDHDSLVSDIRVIELVQHHAIDDVLRNFFIVVQDVFHRDSELRVAFNVIRNHLRNGYIVKAVFLGDGLSQRGFAREMRSLNEDHMGLMGQTRSCAQFDDHHQIF